MHIFIKNLEKKRTILGIDPGTTVMGYGIISIVDKQPKLVTLGVIELNKFQDHYIKLQKIFEHLLVGAIHQFR